MQFLRYEKTLKPGKKVKITREKHLFKIVLIVFTAAL